jgi:hypothetical protein
MPMGTPAHQLLLKTSHSIFQPAWATERLILYFWSAFYAPFEQIATLIADVTVFVITTTA